MALMGSVVVGAHRFPTSLKPRLLWARGEIPYHLGAEESLRGEAVSPFFLFLKRNPFTWVSDFLNLLFPTPGINLLKEGSYWGSYLNHPNTL
jgi:hypothetical protein